MSVRLLGFGNPDDGDLTPPDPPTGIFNLSITASGFATAWTQGPETDIQEHRVYRSSVGPTSDFSLVATVTEPIASYSHTGLTAGQQYWVYITAVDSSNNESSPSATVTATLLSALTYRTVIKFGDSQKFLPPQHSAQRYADFTAMIDWVIANKDTENIDFVMHPGDTIDLGSSLPLSTPGELIFGIYDLEDVDAQWANFNAQWSRLEPSGSWDGIPYVMCRGNHDNMGEAADISAGLDTNGWQFYYNSAKFESLETAFVGRDRFFQHEQDSPSGLSHVFRVQIGDNLVRIVAPTYHVDHNETSWALDRVAENQDIPTRMLNHWWAGNPGVDISIVQPMDTVAPQLFATDQGHTYAESIELEEVGGDATNTIIRGTNDFSENFVAGAGDISWLVRERFYLDGNGNVTDIEADMFNPVTSEVKSGPNQFITKTSFTISPPSDTPYDLYATDSQSRGTIPFAVNFPAPPQTSQNLTVTDQSSFNTALSTSGAHITVAAGSYGALNITGVTDQYWDIDNGATFSSFSGFNASRIHISGGVVDQQGSTSLTGITDWTIHNMNMSLDDDGNSLSGGSGRGGLTIGNPIVSGGEAVRVMMIHCTVRAFKTAVLVSADTEAANYNTDLIFVANYIQGGQFYNGTSAANISEAGLRIMGTHRTVVVDNRLRSGTPGSSFKNGLRSHYGNDNYWARNNIIDYGDGIQCIPRANSQPIVPANYMGDHWYYDNTHYVNVDNPNSQTTHFFRDSGQTNTTTFPGAIIADGNNAYDYRQASTSGVDFARWFTPVQVQDSFSNNVEYPYQSPPTQAAQIAADGLAVGADH